MSVIESSNLVSINDDCKIRIFDYLEYRDLVNIGETSTQLHTAVRDAFKRKYRNGVLVGIIPVEREHGRPNSGSSTKNVDCWKILFEDQRPDIVARTRALILQLLRNFGDTLKHIILFNERPGRVHFTNYVEQYVAKYCLKTLTTLSLTTQPQFLFNRNDPVEFVKVSYLFLDWNQSFPSSASDFPFNESFPNLYCLALGRTNTILPAGFRYLRHLRIEYKSCLSNRCECEEVIQLLRLNPQLNKLEIMNRDTKKCFVRLIKIIQDYLPELKALALNHSNSDIDETFHFKNVTDFRLDLDRINEIPFTFDKLNRFRAGLSPFVKSDVSLEKKVSTILNFLPKNVHLKILTVTDLHFGINTETFSHVIRILSNIENLTVKDDYITISSENIARLLTEMPSLKKLTLVGRNLNTHFDDNLKARITTQTKKREKLGPVTYEVVFVLNR